MAGQRRLLWPRLHHAERREEMFELSEQETSIYAPSPASRISSAARLLGDFVTSAEKQSRVSKKNPLRENTLTPH